MCFYYLSLVWIAFFVSIFLRQIASASLGMEYFHRCLISFSAMLGWCWSKRRELLPGRRREEYASRMQPEWKLPLSQSNFSPEFPQSCKNVPERITSATDRAKEKMDISKGKYRCKRKIRFRQSKNLNFYSMFSKLTGVCGVLMNTAPGDSTFRATFWNKIYLMVMCSQRIALHSAKLCFSSGLQSEAMCKSCSSLEKLLEKLHLKHFVFICSDKSLFTFLHKEHFLVNLFENIVERFVIK